MLVSYLVHLFVIRDRSLLDSSFGGQVRGVREERNKWLDAVRDKALGPHIKFGR